jgi:hypothetical protein
MKKFVTFVMILCLGLFCAIGCSRPAPTQQKPPDNKTEQPKAQPGGAGTEKQATPPAAKPDDKTPAKPGDKKP